MSMLSTDIQEFMISTALTLLFALLYGYIHPRLQNKREKKLEKALKHFLLKFPLRLSPPPSTLLPAFSITTLQIFFERYASQREFLRDNILAMRKEKWSERNF